MVAIYRFGVAHQIEPSFVLFTHLFGGDDFFKVGVEGPGDQGRKHQNRHQGRQPPDPPDQREHPNTAEHTEGKPDRGIARHRDILIGVGAGVGLAPLLGYGEIIAVGDLRDDGKVIGRRRRRDRPFQRAPVPWVTDRCAGFLTVPDADPQLDEDGEQPAGDNQSTDNRDEHVGME